MATLSLRSAPDTSSGTGSTSPGLPAWTELSDTAQLALADAAMAHAASVLAEQAQTLAREIECGALADQGGPKALHLFAALVRALHGETVAGQA